MSVRFICGFLKGVGGENSRHVTTLQRGKSKWGKGRQRNAGKGEEKGEKEDQQEGEQESCGREWGLSLPGGTEVVVMKLPWWLQVSSQHFSAWSLTVIKKLLLLCVCVCACECSSSQVGCLATVLCARRGGYALDSGGPRDGKIDLCGVRMCTAICVWTQRPSLCDDYVYTCVYVYVCVHATV